MHVLQSVHVFIDIYLYQTIQLYNKYTENKDFVLFIEKTHMIFYSNSNECVTKRVCFFDIYLYQTIELYNKYTENKDFVVFIEKTQMISYSNSKACVTKRVCFLYCKILGPKQNKERI
jgi:hypothetical protein